MRSILTILCVSLLSTASLAMDANETPLEKVSKVLSKHTELYNFKNINDAKARLDALEARKKDIIQQELLDGTDSRINQIVKTNTFKILGKKYNKKTVQDWVSFGIGALPTTISTIVGSVFCPPAAAALIPIGLTAVGVWVNTKCNPPPYKQQVKDLQHQKDDITQALKNDPLKKTEQKVLQRWDEFPKGMQDTLTRCLLTLRSPHTNPKDALALRTKISDCLKLPNKSKELIPEAEDTDDPVCFKMQCSAHLDKLFSKEPWSNYPPTTMAELKNAVTDICYEPCKARLGFEPRRQIFFFHGKPGTGKSLAAEEIAKMFDLPKIKVAFSSIEELSQQTIMGNSKWEQEQRLGLLFQPLFEKDKNGETWKNPIVIFEDFDRVLNKVPPFILQLFDPETKVVQCDYLGKKVEVDVSAITFILTSNSDLGQENAKEAKKADAFEALRDRLHFVHFDQMLSKEQKVLLKSYAKKFGLLEFTDFSPSEKNLDDLVDYAIKSNPDASIRGLQLAVEALALNDKWAQGITPERAAVAQPKQKPEEVDSKEEKPKRRRGPTKLRQGYLEPDEIKPEKIETEPEEPIFTPMTSYSGVTNLFTRINANKIRKNGSGCGINVAMVDSDGVDFSDNHLNGTQFRIIDSRYAPTSTGDHATVMALILAGKNSSMGVGMAPRVRIASYANITPYDALKHARETCPIANLSLTGLNPQMLHFGPRFSGDKVDKRLAKTAIVAIAGNDRHNETTMAQGLPGNYYPENGNIIVTVALNSNGSLRPESSRCGKTKRFCVAVPSNGATSGTAPIVSGALALLMESVPGLPVRSYVEAILKTANNAQSPSEETGVGLLNVDAALKWLEASAAKPSAAKADYEPGKCALDAFFKWLR